MIGQLAERGAVGQGVAQVLRQRDLQPLLQSLKHGTSHLVMFG